MWWIVAIYDGILLPSCITYSTGSNKNVNVGILPEGAKRRRIYVSRNSDKNKLYIFRTFSLFMFS